MVTPEPHDPLIGLVLQGKYRIDNLIATGGMGAVYRGVQLAVNRPIAIKVLRRSVDNMYADAAAQASRFEREARATSSLQHPNCVRLYDYSQTSDGILYLVMELLNGPTLKDALRSHGAFPPWRAAKILRQIAKALAEAHGLGIIHRDLKPENVFLLSFEGESDFVKVVDFGIARMVQKDTDQNLTRTGHAIGTPMYMSPDQMRDQPVTTAADLYSLGIIAYELLVGRVPFRGESAVATALKHLNDLPPPLVLPSLPPHVGSAWNALVQRLLAKYPSERPKNAMTVACALDLLEIDSKCNEEDFSAVDDEIRNILRPRHASTADLPTQIVPTTPTRRKPESYQHGFWSLPLLWIAGGTLLGISGMITLAVVASQTTMPSINTEPVGPGDAQNAVMQPENNSSGGSLVNTTEAPPAILEQKHVSVPGDVVDTTTDEPMPDDNTDVAATNGSAQTPQVAIESEEKSKTNTRSRVNTASTPQVRKWLFKNPGKRTDPNPKTRQDEEDVLP
ncbi:MAG: serine/threonine protein kinase [Myxococcales bacterium]|nr:serine/threonine protein kinase [Myxococcales bacterium]